MPFNKETDTNITISKKHKEMLRAIAVEQKRTLRGTVETMIEYHSTMKVPEFHSVYIPEPKLNKSFEWLPVVGKKL